MTATSLRFQSLLEAIVRESAAAGVPLIVLKGLALANLLYGDTSGRGKLDAMGAERRGAGGRG